MTVPLSTVEAVATAVEWRIEKDPVDYPSAVAFMEQRVADIRAARAPEMVWLLEHPALYTAGTSAQDGDLLEPARFPVYRSGRGGQFTYHGPGQRVAYVMLDLKRRGGDVRRFVQDLESWIIAALARFNVQGERRAGRIGIWIDRGHHDSLRGGAQGARTGREDKIAAIGVRLRHWVSYHGIAINVEPDLSHFDGIVPCGIPTSIPGGVKGHGVTSLVDLGLPVTLADLDVALKLAFDEVFGETTDPA
jgi:lipoyl(octanoyl) transferase